MVRFQGGHNAGHTLVIDGVSYKLSLLPSGVVRPGTMGVIGNGVVVDPPHALVAEIARLADQGVTVSRDNLRIAENASLILSLHRELDAMREEAASAGTKIGTTKRGIGPAYEDKVGRRAIRVMDLANPETLPAKIDRMLAHHNPLRRVWAWLRSMPMTCYEELMSVADQVLPFMDQSWRLLDQARKAGKRILFEGAQGALLDVDHGTYPFVDVFSHFCRSAAAGSGIGPSALNMFWASPKPTPPVLARDHSRQNCSMKLDSFLVKKDANLALLPAGNVVVAGSMPFWCVRPFAPPALPAFALTKLDVLDGLEEIKICVGYMLDGERIDYLPASQGGTGTGRTDL